MTILEWIVWAIFQAMGWGVAAMCLIVFVVVVIPGIKGRG